MDDTDCPVEPYDVNELLEESQTVPDFIIDGIHFGRGDYYRSENAQLKHKTTKITCWRIANESLEEIECSALNNFYNCETYIIRWESITSNFRVDSDDLLSTHENTIYFYWKGEDAAKGYSPLPETIEKENPPVERVVQWAEPPAFLRLFRGKFIVHFGKYNSPKTNPRLYILRGDVEAETHLFEVELEAQNLRSRTSFVVYFPKEKSSIIWHGSQSNSSSRNLIKVATENVFGSNFEEIDEGSENETFSKLFAKTNEQGGANSDLKVLNYTPRLFYFNKITGEFNIAEIECSHKSSNNTPFPFLQSHLYTAEQPAIFLLDDNDEIWIWYGWQCDEDGDFKSECFLVALNYAKQKSKIIQKLVKVHKVIAGFETDDFTHLFPTWKKREDIAKLQEKDGVLPDANPLIQIISNEDQ